MNAMTKLNVKVGNYLRVRPSSRKYFGEVVEVVEVHRRLRKLDDLPDEFRDVLGPWFDVKDQNGTIHERATHRHFAYGVLDGFLETLKRQNAQ